jgi:hypothetical protein
LAFEGLLTEKVDEEEEILITLGLRILQKLAQKKCFMGFQSSFGVFHYVHGLGALKCLNFHSDGLYRHENIRLNRRNV